MVFYPAKTDKLELLNNTYGTKNNYKIMLK